MSQTGTIKKKKTKLLPLARIAVQLVMFVLIPGLYVSALNGIKVLLTALVGWKFSLSLLPQLIEVMAVIPVTVLFGRFFCGWMCAFGFYGDMLYLLSKKLFKLKWRIGEKTDAILKNIKYVVLAFIIIIIWGFNVTLFQTSSPWDAFGMLASFGKLPDFSYVLSSLTVGLLALLVISLGSLFIERFFCRYLCPLGAVFALVSFLRIGNVKKPRKSCGRCRICTNECAMGIPLYQTDSVKSMECINCMKCVSACPRNNAQYTVAQKDVRPLLAGLAAAGTMNGLIIVGNLSSNTSLFGVTETVQAGNTINKIYNDGTYTGSATGFRNGILTVSVTIKNDKITNIETVSYSDDTPYYIKAYRTVVKEIISAQNTDVDTVSGATYSSRGIMNAVADALESAKIVTVSSNSSDTSSADTSDSSSSEPERSYPESKSSSSSEAWASSSSSDSSAQASSSSSVSTATYKDGTYTGSGIGFRGKTTVSVTVKNGTITDIETVSTEDDRPYYYRAYNSIVSQIISGQSIDVDAVSGATYSSRGIMSAVKDALSNAE